MKIGPVDSGDRPHRPGEEESRKVNRTPERQERQNRTDKVDISSTGRSMSEQNSPAGESPEAENRSDKVERARQRIESGYYDAADVKEEIARRIADDFIG